jgi:hypothetical protein
MASNWIDYLSGASTDDLLLPPSELLVAVACTLPLALLGNHLVRKWIIDPYMKGIMDRAAEAAERDALQHPARGERLAEPAAAADAPATGATAAGHDVDEDDADTDSEEEEYERMNRLLMEQLRQLSPRAAAAAAAAKGGRTDAG